MMTANKTYNTQKGHRGADKGFIVSGSWAKKRPGLRLKVHKADDTSPRDYSGRRSRVHGEHVCTHARTQHLMLDVIPVRLSPSLLSGSRNKDTH